jgi:excinuclease ABC subunit C
MSGVALSLALSEEGRARLRRRVAALAEARPAVYRMLDASGRVIYVGKAKRLRPRLLSYFRARYPDDKGARILAAAHDIAWDYVPSEFAAYLGELRLIQRHRPPFNVRMKRPRRLAFVKVTGGAAPKIFVGARPGNGEIRNYGPYRAGERLDDAVRVLNLELGLRDCALDMPVVYREQGDLFGATRRAACIRYELGTCTGPCGGFVTEADYRARVEVAVAFLEGRGIAPLDRVIEAMTAASRTVAYEQAARWRDRFDALEWLFAEGNRVRVAIDALSFVYTDPGAFGDERSYIIRRATVRASAPAPRTPIEREAFNALLAEHTGPEPATGPLPTEAIEEMVLLLSWFRRHPGALRKTEPLVVRAGEQAGATRPVQPAADQP